MATDTVSSKSGLRALHPATLAALFSGVALSCLLFLILQASEHARNDFDVDRRVQARVAAVTRSFDDAAEAMRATNLCWARRPRSAMSSLPVSPPHWLGHTPTSRP